jgi:transcriptional regulator with GAF, ATPase, and Fis domain
MSNTMSWRTEPSPNPVTSPIAPFEATLHDERLDALRDLVLMLLRELESLQIDPSNHSDCSAGLQNQVQRFESDLIRQALHRTGGNQARAARLLGVKPTTLNAKIQRHKILIGQSEESESIVRDHMIAL